ncbi:MAG: YicC/YloC family endoribonuclease [Candidatus Sumerlaeia bacterium]|nr:YicC/YloC family endoribonuclease [Candidatus Sumerlaeia bacterium]
MRSMTGYGRGAAANAQGRVVIELRSLNHRFLELSIHLPGALGVAEGPLRRRLNEAVGRGKVTLSARFDPADDAGHCGYTVNRGLLQLLFREVALHRGPVTDERHRMMPEILLLANGVVQPSVNAEGEGRLTELCLAALEEAVETLTADRSREGGAHARALARNGAALRAGLAGIDAARPLVAAAWRDKLKARIAELLPPGAPPLDAGRLETELALFADRADISEECVRLAAHLDALDAMLADPKGPHGRRLDFLSQEIGREINTIGSKSRDLGIAQAVLAMKNELESLRELAANIE